MRISEYILGEGGIAFIQKPFEESELLNAIDKAFATDDKD